MPGRRRVSASAGTALPCRLRWPQSGCLAVILPRAALPVAGRSRTRSGGRSPGLGLARVCRLGAPGSIRGQQDASRKRCGYPALISRAPPEALGGKSAAELNTEADGRLDRLSPRAACPRDACPAPPERVRWGPTLAPGRPEIAAPPKRAAHLARRSVRQELRSNRWVRPLARLIERTLTWTSLPGVHEFLTVAEIA